MGQDIIVGDKAKPEAGGEFRVARDTVQTGRENAGFESDSDPSTGDGIKVKEIAIFH